jgi:hypothetical protein
MTRAKQQRDTQQDESTRAVCLFDFETPTRLRCLVCPDHRLLLLLPERRAAMLALLLGQGQLRGQAKEEAERQQESQPHHQQKKERPVKKQARSSLAILHNRSRTT